MTTTSRQDQAAGLRAWAAQQGNSGSVDAAVMAEAKDTRVASSTGNDKSQHTQHVEPSSLQQLLVLAHPSWTQAREHASEALIRYHEEGWKWVGSPEQWQLHACAPSAPNFIDIAQTIPRWALWIDTDLHSFQRAYRVLCDLRDTGMKMPRMLLMHPPMVSRRGLINNVQQMARDFFNIELLVLQR
ncbi:hypothetical protein [Aliidiomarina indica]|uniref:hypothetical protein n=1 Tax=Aliidiomarina indica TaxID=2749147 RepID=UPI00188F4723|nr:hypothetical protein [Aliidiomarina indica]